MLMREAGLKARQLWVDGKNVRGYVEKEIIRAWLHYCGEEWFTYYEPGDP